MSTVLTKAKLRKRLAEINTKIKSLKKDEILLVKQPERIKSQLSIETQRNTVEQVKLTKKLEKINDILSNSKQKEEHLVAKAKKDLEKTRTEIAQLEVEYKLSEKEMLKLDFSVSDNRLDSIE